MRLLLLLCLITLTSCISNLTDDELIETYQESINNNDWKKALSCVEEGLNRNPNDTHLYFSKAFCLKNINPIDNHKKILENLDLFLNKNKTSSRARLLRYTTLYENKHYFEAIKEVEQIEKYFGISANTLLMKANAQFLNKDYENSAFNYEEATMYPHQKEKFKFIYYYKIYSKYFSKNKDGAMWDASFLENYNLEKNNDLLKSISNDELKISDYNEIPFSIDIESFDKDIRLKVSLDYDLLYRPLYSKKMFYEPNYKATDLKRLDKNIEFLNLSYSNTNELPNNITEFKKLRGLRLFKNKIKKFDKLFEQLSQLPNLEYLELDSSNLKNFPSSISKLQNLKSLSIEASNISKLPPEIGYLYNLSYLSIRNNSKIKDLPKEIKHLKNLNCLDVSGTGLEKLGEEIGLCYNLLAIKGNASKIKTIPNTIGNLKNLKLLNLGFNKIKIVPQNIGNINYLTNLNLGSNEIEKLPKSIRGLANLEMLSLEFNRFKEFPKEVLSLGKLQTLWLHNNNFSSIPIDVTDLSQLTHLLVDHEMISEQNIKEIKEKRPNLYVMQEDCRKYVRGLKRKK